MISLYSFNFSEDDSDILYMYVRNDFGEMILKMQLAANVNLVFSPAIMFFS